MAKFRYQHIKSSVEGKAPTAEQIKVAEIGVNDFAGDEKLFIKNSEGEVVDFPRGYSQAVIDENERVTAEALNDLNSRKLDASAYTPTDLSNYYTKDETSGKTEIQDALDDKADTATTYTKTEVDARDLWVSGTGTNSVAQKGGNNTASGNYSIAEGYSTSATNLASHAEGYNTLASGSSSHAEGYSTQALGMYSHAEGDYTVANNYAEHAMGHYNVSSKVSNTFGNSGNTLFSVGNGTYSEGHNAFEIRQNGDIYITSGNTDVKLQDSIPSVDGYADSVKYNSTTHFVEFYHGTTAGTKVFEYDASPFLIDGMVENVEIEDVEISGETVTCLVISFNTAAGKQDINIPLTEIFDPNVYYTKTEVDTALAGKVSTSDVDQVIDSTTSASTGAVSTSAVYGFVTSYTPSITVDQVLDNTTSASTNPVSSKAVYDAVTDNELVWTNAFVTLSGVVSSHTENTDIHVTAADKDNWDAKLDASAYTPTDLSNYYTKTEVDARDLWVSGTGTNSVAQKGGNNTASGLYSHAEGNYTRASGQSSHAEGWTTTAGGDYSHAEGNNTTASGESSHAEGRWTKANGGYGSHAEGYYATASGTSSHAEGQWTRTNGDYSHAEGYYTITLNDSEHASGQYNDSVSASTTFGNSGNTLFSVGNGTAENARHNAFEIRQNGDIYITSGGTGILLQESLGGTVDQVIDSGTSASTNAVATKAVYDALIGKADTSDIPSVDGYADSVMYNSTTHYVEFYHGTTAGTKVFEYDASPFLIDGMVQNVEIDDVTSGASTVKCLVISFNTDSGKQDINIPIADIFDSNDYYTKDEIDDIEYVISTSLNDLERRKLDASDIDQSIDSGTSASTGAVSTSAVYDFITSYTPSLTVDQVLDSTTSASTNPVATKAVYEVIRDNELVTSNAINIFNIKKADKSEDLDGIKLKKITQSAYDALVQAGTVDPNTLYIITD